MFETLQPILFLLLSLSAIIAERRGKSDRRLYGTTDCAEDIFLTTDFTDYTDLRPTDLRNEKAAGLQRPAKERMKNEEGRESGRQRAEIRSPKSETPNTSAEGQRPPKPEKRVEKRGIFWIE